MPTPPSTSYCASRLRTIRRRSVPVLVGPVGIGGDHPIRVQSMTTSDTQDVAATVRQCIALAEVGCEVVRVTAPNTAAAQCLRPIREQFSAAGFAHVPLVADIHFLPQAAMEAVEHVEKVRVNPGNYADKKKFAVRDYSDADYDRELARLHEAFSPLVKRAKQLGRALRIGTNHGSLSDRIMNRYGDTPLGMVESALEFVRICEDHGFHDLMLSMKASNPKVMIQAYRLLVARMDAAHRPYPLHLGVTEAGDGEDGRIKSAIGIGSLLLDGVGDTIRVSLTEDSVYEIPVARALAAKAMSLWSTPATGATGDERTVEDPLAAGRASTPPPVVIRHSDFVIPPEAVDPFTYTRRVVAAVEFAPGVATGPEQPPRVLVRAGPPERVPAALAALASPRLADTPAEGLLVDVRDDDALAALAGTLASHDSPVGCLVLELGAAASPAALDAFLGAARGRVVPFAQLPRGDAADGDRLDALTVLSARHGTPLALGLTAASATALASRLTGIRGLIVTLSPVAGSEPSAHPVGRYRALAAAMRAAGLDAPLWIRNTSATVLPAHDASFLSRLLDGAILTGALLCDGLGDLVSVETEPDCARATTLAYNLLQGAGTRSSKTEFVACPSCGRTLFDLQTTTQRIRAQTGHLKGVKIAIMGCIVNGPGEMADADFGYVGGAPGKINLYVGKTCVQYNIPQAEADARLIALIKEHGKWVEPAAPIPLAQPA